MRLTTITSIAAGKRSFGNKNSPPELLLFTQTFPKSYSYPTVRAEMQMKGLGQVLTGSWRREGPEVLSAKQEFTDTRQSANRSMHPRTRLGFFSDMKGYILSSLVRWDWGCPHKSKPMMWEKMASSAKKGVSEGHIANLVK